MTRIVGPRSASTMNGEPGTTADAQVMHACLTSSPQEHSCGGRESFVWISQLPLSHGSRNTLCVQVYGVDAYAR